MTNTLQALIDRILDVTLAHLLIARERLAIRRTDRLQSRPHSARNRQHVAAEGYQIARGRRSQDLWHVGQRDLHPDEARRHGSDGTISMQLNQPSGGQFTALMINGAQAYVLFASMVERTPDPAQPLSSSRAAFRILDTLSFADAISRWIPGFTHGVQGPCVYRPTTLLTEGDCARV